MNFFSQHGEDRWIFENLQIPKVGAFMDIGAYDGVASSNTLAFEEMGWSGICIEPDLEIAAQCRKNRAPRTDVYCCAIGRGSPFQDLIVNPADRGSSGLQRPETRCRQSVLVNGLVLFMHRFEVGALDLLSIDTEGTESEVWRSMGIRSDSRIGPKIVIVEYRRFDDPPTDAELKRLIEADGYKEVHRTHCNLIFVPCA